MKETLLLIILIFANSINAQHPFELAVWSNKTPPNSNEISEKEIYNKNVKGFQNVTIAKLYVYLPQKPTLSPAVLICPGGGYTTVNLDNCHQFAKWIVNKGVAAIVLKYRTPNGHPEVPISDAQEAFSIIYKHAKQWKINESKIGVAGFSAGGHLASYLATHFFDSIIRPAFAMQFFSVINANSDYAHKPSIENLLGNNPSKESLDFYSNDIHISSYTPTTIIFCPSNDPIVNSLNSIDYCLKLKEHKVPVAMYLFPIKAHGDFMEETHPYNLVWEELLDKWMKTENLIN